MDEISKRAFLAAGLSAALPLSAKAAEPGRKLGNAILGLRMVSL